VRKGDNLSKIAKRNGVTVAQLKSWNKLKSTLLPIGKQLIVGKNASPATVTEYKKGEDQSSDAPEGSNIISEYLKEKINDSGKQKAGNI
jgi:membrane-bound lytic murein transglycosylase D